MKNVIVLVLDGVGIGEAPDAYKYGDENSASIQHTLEVHHHTDLKNLEKLGLGKITPLYQMNPNIEAIGAYGKLASKTLGKDTIVGHWELMGLIIDKPFQTFPNGFSKKMLDEFSRLTGYGYLGNSAESGTEIIKRLGDEHIKTKKLIVYTSADSVFQIASDENTIPLKELYRVCEITRKICDKYMIGRVIARPFIKTKKGFERTVNRKDFSSKPFKKTALNYLEENNILTIGIGKIPDIFQNYGIKEKIPVHGNPDCTKATLDCLKNRKNSFIFTNLVDTDMLYGHRRDPQGYYQCLKEFDESLSEYFKIMDDSDLLIIVADHGNDPTFKGSDHTREYIPLIVYSKSMKKNIDLNTGDTFADVGKTVLDFFKVTSPLPGQSFLNKLKI
jgi:phosphopentomutase